MSSATWYTPEEAQAVFREANAAYVRGALADAEAGYLKLLEHGSGGQDVLYNLGTTALAQGKLGEAVLYLERARREGPDSADLETNLALAHSRQLDKVVGEAVQGTFLERVATATPIQAAGPAFVTLWVLGLGLLAVRRLVRGGLRAACAVGAAVMLVVAVPLGGLLAAHAWVGAHVEEAVVLAGTAQAREFPSPEGKVAFEVHVGLMVRVLERSGDFVRIRLPNGREGWTQAEHVASL
jgi:tetratricopeptide (TPR) repeat protein